MYKLYFLTDFMTLISCFSKKNGRKIIHHELIHLGKGSLILADEHFGQGLNIYPSDEISLFHIDTHDEL